MVKYSLTSLNDLLYQKYENLLLTPEKIVKFIEESIEQFVRNSNSTKFEDDLKILKVYDLSFYSFGEGMLIPVLSFRLKVNMGFLDVKKISEIKADLIDELMKNGFKEVTIDNENSTREVSKFHIRLVLNCEEND